MVLKEEEEIKSSFLAWQQEKMEKERANTAMNGIVKGLKDRTEHSTEKIKAMFKFMDEADKKGIAEEAINLVNKIV